MGRTPAEGPAAAAVLSDGPLLGRKKELADILRLLRGGADVTIIGPAGVGKKRLAQAVLTEFPEASASLRTALVPLGLAGEQVYRLRPLAEAPAVELYRVLHDDDTTPYAELASRCRAVGNLPGAIAALE
jgi:hypothetical protein